MACYNLDMITSIVSLTLMLLINGELPTTEPTLPTKMPPERQRVHFDPLTRKRILTLCKAPSRHDGKEVARAHYCDCVLDNVVKFVTQDEYDISDRAVDAEEFHRRAPVTTQIIAYCLAQYRLDLEA